MDIDIPDNKRMEQEAHESRARESIYDPAPELHSRESDKCACREQYNERAVIIPRNDILVAELELDHSPRERESDAADHEHEHDRRLDLRDSLAVVIEVRADHIHHEEVDDRIAAMAAVVRNRIQALKIAAREVLRDLDCRVPEREQQHERDDEPSQRLYVELFKAHIDVW